MACHRDHLAAALLLVLASAAAVTAQDGPDAVTINPGSSVAAANPEAEGLAESTADARPSSTLLSRIRPGRAHNRRQAPVDIGAYPERHRMAVKLPDMSALTAEQLSAMQTSPAGSAPSSDDQGIKPAANGAGGAGYADSRFGSGPEYTALAATRVGKLYMRFSGQWYVCTATVINRALLLTAAHCVFDYGQGTSGWVDRENGVLQVYFRPGLDNTNARLGTWWAAGVMVPQPYQNGTDTCDSSAVGVVCNNDLALIWLNANATGTQIGDLTGWMAYGWNGFSFSAPASGYGFPAGQAATAMLTQFGYPAAFDQGLRMQISNAATYTYASTNKDLKNILRGSSMTGGSSGGPWIANYGTDAVLSGTTYGSNTDRNRVMGVTSWGYGDDSSNIKVMGASYFGVNKQFTSANYGTRGAGNIGKIMYDACDNPAIAGWQLKSKGLCV